MRKGGSRRNGVCPTGSNPELAGVARDHRPHATALQRLQAGLLLTRLSLASDSLALVGQLLIVSGPGPAGKSATHFLELGCCPHSAGDGSLALRGLGSACMPSGIDLGLSLPASDLDPLRPYHLVLLLPAGSVAQLEVAVSDAP